MPYTTLISATELAAHIGEPNWIVLDCRHDLSNPEFGRAAYNEGHLPHAQFAHLDTDLAGDKFDSQGRFRGRHPLPQREKFIATLRRWGINDDSQVVAYDAHGGMFAARLWWMLRWAGHEAVAVLDGGLPAWTAQGLPLSTEVVVHQAGTLGERPSLVSEANAEDLLRNLESGQRVVIDARAPDRFRGENETLDAVGGHIPGAKNRFFKDNLGADGRFKPAEQLRADFSQWIVEPTRAVMQCGSGVTACHNLLALEVAGLKGAALYPGSWSEWCGDTARPVARD
jgi:thiosulfate/3-mercaptopyruvate sulfurtransferase